MTVAYSWSVREVRRCRARTQEGNRCRSFAMWASSLGVCAGHGGRRERQAVERVSGERVHAKYEPCDCNAYPFPHRPAGGDCVWPAGQILATVEVLVALGRLAKCFAPVERKK